MPVQGIRTFRISIDGKIVTDRTIGAYFSGKDFLNLPHVIDVFELDDLVFKCSLPIRASYDDQDGCWCLKNERLSLSGYGKTCREALGSLSDHLESLLVEFLAFEDAALSGKSRQIKKRLQTHLDLNDANRRFGRLAVEN